jgi:hypothetical protein
MRALSVAGDYRLLGRLNDIDGIQVFAARKNTGEELYSVQHFPVMSPVAEQELRGLMQRTRTLDDPIVALPVELVRTEEGFFIVSDFVSGESIEQIVKNSRVGFNKLIAVAIARDLALCLARARERTGRSLGDVTSGQVIVCFETGDLKLVGIGASLLRSRSPITATKAVGLILYEMLAGRKLDREMTPPKAGSDLDRIVMNAIANSMDDDLNALAEELKRYLHSRTTGIDRSAELAKLVRTHFSHKAAAMRALATRWRSQSNPGIQRRPTSGIRPVVEKRTLEAALSEPIDDIVILDAEEIAPTDDLSSINFKRPSSTWPQARAAFLLLLLMLSFATSVLVLLNGEGDSIVSSWTSVIHSLSK